MTHTKDKRVSGAARLIQIDKYQMLPDMTPDQYAALKEDIAERGVLVPLDVDEHGNILDGHHRYRACVELGITDFPTIVRPGMTEEGRRMFARKSNMLRRHLTREQVRQLVVEQLKDTPSWADRRIGQELGVDHKTVAGARARLLATGEIPQFDKLVGMDAKERPAKPVKPPAVMAPNFDELERVLKRMEGMNAEQITGFLSEQGLVAAAIITTPNYNPFAHCSETEKWEWNVFVLLLAHGCRLILTPAPRFDVQGAWGHVEWILQRQFKSPDEWLGAEGRKWRTRWGMHGASEQFETAWKAFLSGQHGRPLADIEKEFERLESEPAPKRKARAMR